MAHMREECIYYVIYNVCIVLYCTKPSKFQNDLTSLHINTESEEMHDVNKDMTAES